MDSNPSACACPDPRSCTCYHASPYPPPFPTYYPQYPSAGPAYHTWDPSATYNAPTMQYTPPNPSTPHAPTYWQNPPPFPIHAPSLPQNFQAPLTNITTSSSVNNLPNPATSTAPKRKRAAAGSSNPASKRRNTSAPSSRTPDENQAPGSVPTPPPVPSIPGLGPQISPAASQSSSTPPTTDSTRSDEILDSLAEKAAKASNALATDVWFFLLGAKSAEKPDHTVVPPTSKRQPSVKEYSHMGCRLCLFSEKNGHKWTKWANAHGQTHAVRVHLQKYHQTEWEEMVIANRLKDWEKLQRAPGRRLLRSNPSNSWSYEPFSIAGFIERLIAFIAADDQSLGVVDCEEFRALLEYICPSLREAGAIPHRTKLGDLVTEAFRAEYDAMVSDIENALGRVSFTSDIWSRQNLQSYMAVTAHYMANKPSPIGPLLTLKTRLVAFRVLHGSHTGVNLGKVFVKILEEIKCLHKISMITLDNASNNATMMSEIEAELNELGIAFDHDGNRIRCFPHVINLAVKEGLKYLTQLPEPGQASSSGPEYSLDYSDQLLADDDYFTALQSDVVANIRRFVTSVRASGQRRDQFQAILRAGNAAGGWGDPPTVLRDAGLKKEVETRWSSTYNMVDHFVELYLVCAQLIKENDDFAGQEFTDAQVRVAKDIRVFLQVFHSVQELVSAEKTPTLSIVLPLYELLIKMLKTLARARVKIAHAINASIAKLEDYLAISRKTKIYAMAMVINPKIKFSWLKSNWTTTEYKDAKESVKAALLEFAQSESEKSREAANPPPPTRTLVKSLSVSNAAHAQTAGYARLEFIQGTLERSLSEPSIGTAPATLPSTPTEFDPARQKELDQKRVKDELRAYKAAGLFPEMSPIDLVRFWQDHRTVYPLLYRVALDVLPVQASAVPCERVFSSSKETDTNRRSNLAPERMEHIQILKFGARGERLCFTDDLICTEQEVCALDVDPQVLNDMYERGEIEKLEKYLADSWIGWGAETTE